MHPEVPRLLLITDPSLGDPVEATGRALRGAPGGVAVQLRDKTRSGGPLLGLALALRRVTRAAGAALLINGRVDVALASGAEGVHLPEDGLPPAEARRLLGPAALIGASRHDDAGLAAAAAGGADYATLSPFASSPGKGPPLGSDRFAALARGASLPVLALGGIDVAAVPAALAAGAHGVAVVRAVYTAADPAAATAALVAALDRVRHGGR